MEIFDMMSCNTHFGMELCSLIYYYHVIVSGVDLCRYIIAFLNDHGDLHDHVFYNMITILFVENGL